jgi:hypothetical protein
VDFLSTDLSAVYFQYKLVNSICTAIASEKTYYSGQTLLTDYTEICGNYRGEECGPRQSEFHGVQEERGGYSDDGGNSGGGYSTSWINNVMCKLYNLIYNNSIIKCCPRSLSKELA